MEYKTITCTEVGSSTECIHLQDTPQITLDIGLTFLFAAFLAVYTSKTIYDIFRLS